MSVEFVGRPDQLAKRWVLLPRVHYEGLGEAIRLVLESKTRETDLETAKHLLRLAVAWETAEREVR